MNAGALPPTTWTTGSTEAIRTGTWRAFLPRYVSAPSPCHAACPVSGDIAQWIGLARERDFRGAWETLTINNPFPSIAGRICHHPCETACNRAGFDESLAICKLERHVGDVALAQGWSFAAPAAERAERVAVIGGGPSGLSAAFQLRRLGYQVTLFESMPRLGGLMRYGIPAYRLSRDVLDGEIARIVAMGVEVRCNAAVDDEASLARVRASHDAVYVAVGARRQKRLPQLDPGEPWVVDGARYLAQANDEAAPKLGRRVVVIGGGSAAMDAARSALRAGHEVTVLSLERRSQMPAHADEVDEAIEEGIALCDGAMLERARAANGAVSLECVRVNFVAGAERGQFRVEPIEQSAFTIEADAIITSIGQDPDLAPYPEAFGRSGALLGVNARLATSVERVYAGGDVASMDRFVTEAVGMGKRAALSIHRELSGAAGATLGPASTRESPPELFADIDRLVGLERIATAYYPPAERAPSRRIDLERRVTTDAEVQLGFDLDQALAETTRCFSCGNCIRCDNCFQYCPDLAIRRVPGGYEVLTDYCKGCGVCVRECPTGSMEMVEELR
ncbi:MAG TPA: NAD(P)-binding protein [Burkholderiaceae bacterium]